MQNYIKDYDWIKPKAPEVSAFRLGWGRSFRVANAETEDKLLARHLSTSEQNTPGQVGRTKSIWEINRYT